MESKGKKILVADDENDILEIISYNLVSEGYEVFTVKDGNEALDMARKIHPDLIILDILLSGNDGRTICKRLKKDKSTGNIPVIMISAHPSAHETIAECGADSFIAKPFSVSDLLKQVEEHVN